ANPCPGIDPMSGEGTACRGDLSGLCLNTPGLQLHMTGQEATHQSVPRTGAPVSLAQERLWVLEQFAPGNPVYRLSAAYRLTGAVSFAAHRFARSATAVPGKGG